MVDASTPSTKDKNPCSPASETVEIVSHPEKCLTMNATLLLALAANLQTAVAGPSGACKVSRSMKRRLVAKLSSRQVNTLPPIAEAHVPDFE